MFSILNSFVLFQSFLSDDVDMELEQGGVDSTPQTPNSTGEGICWWAFNFESMGSLYFVVSWRVSYPDCCYGCILKLQWRKLSTVSRTVGWVYSITRWTRGWEMHSTPLIHIFSSMGTLPPVNQRGTFEFQSRSSQIPIQVQGRVHTSIRVCFCNLSKKSSNSRR